MEKIDSEPLSRHLDDLFTIPTVQDDLHIPYNLSTELSGRRPSFCSLKKRSPRACCHWRRLDTVGTGPREHLLSELRN